MRKLVLVILFIVALPFSNAFGQQSLTTIFAENNGNLSVFFDIENITSVPITILSWDNNFRDCDIGGPLDVSVYTRNGTSQGFETSPAGWSLIGTVTNAVCNPDDTPSPLNIGGIVIDPGQTIGVAMVIENPDDAIILFGYTNGTGGNQDYNNGELEIRTGSAMFSPFTASTINSPRVWNGTVFYELIILQTNVPTLSEWGLISMASILGIVGFMVIRRRKVSA